MPLRRWILAVLVGALVLDVAISLLVLEDGAFRGRPLPPYGAVTNARQAAWLERALVDDAPAAGIGRFDRELGWSYEPGTTSVNTLYTINASGARSTREYAPEPPPGVTRILCFGDSFTFCEEVADADAWPALLERHRGIEAVNFGVGGYGTDQALLRFGRKAPRMRADAVAIGMLLENIGRNVNRYRPLWYPRTGTPAVKPRFALVGGVLELVPQPFETRAALIEAVRDGTIIARLAEHEHWLGRPRMPFRASSLARIAAGYFAYRARDPERLWRDTTGEPFEVTVALLESFYESATMGGERRAVVLLFPQRSDVEGYIERDERYWSGLTDALDTAGIPYLDLAVPLASHHQRSLEDPSLGEVFYGGHLSPVGNSIAADRVFAWLKGP